MKVASYNKNTNEFWSKINEDKKPCISKDISNIAFELGLIESSLTYISSMIYEMPDSFKLSDDTVSDMISGIINYLRRLLSDLDDATANTITVKVSPNTLSRFYELCEKENVDDTKKHAEKLFDEVVNSRYRHLVLNK